jgi:oxygen-independent coproporphyrinogen III oxidase
MPPSALYIHIPFCLRRCSYCNFASSIYDKETVSAYLAALNAECARRGADLRPETIYIGGGTPSCLPPDALDELLRNVESLDLSTLREFTVEANPGAVSVEKFMRLRQAGATRISLGAQTFHERGLKILGRIHSAAQTRTAVAMAREAGFDDLSLDLIYGWPGESTEDWFEDLDRAEKLEATHLSIYGLVYEEGTPLHRRLRALEIRPAGEETERAMFDLAGAFLPQRGLHRYEISAYARPGHRSAHNLNYWSGGEYAGLGTGAHSYIGGVRFANADTPEKYIRIITECGDARTWEERLPPDRAARERLVVGLRMIDGIDINQFRAESGFSIQDLLGAEIIPLIEDGWLILGDGRLRLSQSALPVADTILAELVA